MVSRFARDHRLPSETATPAVGDDIFARERRLVRAGAFERELRASGRLPARMRASRHSRLVWRIGSSDGSSATITPNGFSSSTETSTGSTSNGETVIVSSASNFGVDFIDNFGVPADIGVTPDFADMSGASSSGSSCSVVSTLFFRLSRMRATAARSVAVTPLPVIADASTAGAPFGFR